MERLTDKRFDCMEDFCDEKECLIYEYCNAIKKHNRLFAYEETGLTPEEVTLLRDRSEWIPAARELPSEEAVREHYDRYKQDPKYIVMINGGILPTILSFDGNYFYDDVTNEPYGVAHWMELPAPPATTPQSAWPADSSPDKGSQGDAEKENI